MQRLPKLREVLARRAVHVIRVDESLALAAQRMSTVQVGALLVVDGGASSSSKPLVRGIVTERDVLRAAGALVNSEAGATPWAKSVALFMTPSSRLVSVDAGEDLLNCAVVMANKNVSHLPVMEGRNDIVGILSASDVLSAFEVDEPTEHESSSKADFLSSRGLPEHASLHKWNEPPLELEVGTFTQAHKSKASSEDAHCIVHSSDGRGRSLLAVADGVGSWAIERGIDAGLFSRALIDYVSRFGKTHLDAANIISTMAILEDSWNSMLGSCENYNLIGASTICILGVDGIMRELYASNLGDSGFMLLRRPRKEQAGTIDRMRHRGSLSQECVYRSEQQVYAFNCPYQLGIDVDNQSKWDSPRAAFNIRIPLADEDLIVLATDGLFDNLFESEILDLCSEEGTVQQIADKLGKIAVDRSLDQTRDSPFAVLAKENNIMYGGGMPDDITIVMARVHAG